LHDAFVFVLDTADDMNLRGLVEQVSEVVTAQTHDELKKYGSPDSTQYAMSRVNEFIEHRRQQLELWLPCLRGEFVDHDSDGYDGCTVDCDDHNETAYPTAIEVCNFQDDDCNGVIDDPTECPRCLDEIGVDGQRYSYCWPQLPWEQARSFCLDRGQDLASFHDENTWSQIETNMPHFAEKWWIGLTDLEQENQFTWADGSPFYFEAWASGHPEPSGEQRDCVYAAPWGWIDNSCNDTLSFVCKG